VRDLIQILSVFMIKKFLCFNEYVAVIHLLLLFTCCCYSRVAVIHVLMLFMFCCFSHIAVMHVLLLFT